MRTRKARLDMPDVSHFLLLHGAFHIGAAWDSAIGALAEIGFTAEAITFPGHGRSADRAGISTRPATRAGGPGRAFRRRRGHANGGAQGGRQGGGRWCFTMPSSSNTAAR